MAGIKNGRGNINSTVAILNPFPTPTFWAHHWTPSSLLWEAHLFSLQNAELCASTTYSSGLRGYTSYSPHLRRSLPNMHHMSSEPPKIYPAHLLFVSNYRLPNDVDRCHLEVGLIVSYFMKDFFSFSIFLSLFLSFYLGLICHILQRIICLLLIYHLVSKEDLKEFLRTQISILNKFKPKRYINYRLFNCLILILLPIFSLSAPPFRRRIWNDIPHDTHGLLPPSGMEEKWP